MSENATRIIRLSWDEWLASRAAKKAALEAKGYRLHLVDQLLGLKLAPPQSVFCGLIECDLI